MFYISHAIGVWAASLFPAGLIFLNSRINNVWLSLGKDTLHMVTEHALSDKGDCPASVLFRQFQRLPGTILVIF